MTLPRQLLRSMGLDAGAPVDVELEDGRLVLSAARPRYRLEDLLKGMCKADMPTSSEWETSWSPKFWHGWRR